MNVRYLFDLFLNKFVRKVCFLGGTKSGRHPIYANAERKSILATKWPWRVTCVNFITSSIFFAAQQIIMDWMNGDIDPTHWTITYKLRFEFFYLN